MSRPPTPPKDVAEDELESSEEMDAIALELQDRVDNWHGLDFSKYDRPKSSKHDLLTSTDSDL